MNDAIYRGRVRHRRLGPAPASFEQSLHCVYLDVDSIDRSVDSLRLLSRARFAPLSYRREDYLGPAHLPLGDAVRNAIAEKGDPSRVGRIFMLSQLRSFGHLENPVTFYYAFDREDGHLAHVVAEITNNPWRERHREVLSREASLGDARTLRFRFDKTFHVSPFQPMDLTYAWTFTTPGERLVVHMTSLRGEVPVFEAALTLTRRPLTDVQLVRALAAHPWMSATIAARTYAEAARLLFRGADFHPHPSPRGAICPARRREAS